MKKKMLKYIVVCMMALPMGACSDFFNVDTDNLLDSGEYINEESEMYAGFMGLTTKVQAIGDKIIYLTDTRAEMLEPTRNTPDDLYNIYNYSTDLEGNSYADPAAYYDVIIACNDYFIKLRDYKDANSASIDMTHYRALMSATVRLKAWTYLTLAKIYGEAAWFDDPLREKKDLSQFPVKKLPELIKSCINLMDTGFDGVDGRQDFIKWVDWIDPEGTEGSGSANKYFYWDYMVPPYFVLYAELCLWDGNYKRASDLILETMNAKFKSTVNDATDWMRNDAVPGKYAAFWDATSPSRPETISVILYDYKKNQTNSLLKHFGTETPNEYLLAPSEVGRNRFVDPLFNPLGGSTSDGRASIAFVKNSAGDYVIQKYRRLNSTARTNAYQDDVQIYIYRGADLYFMLAEALNNQGRFEEAAALINQGVNNAFPSGGVSWDGFTDDWTSNSSLGNRKYPDKGIRGIFKLGDRAFTQDIKANDQAILDEMLLEFPCEGRTYPAMIRMALRHGDLNMIADRVCDKYSNAAEIRSKIQSGAYFIKWDLNK